MENNEKIQFNSNESIYKEYNIIKKDIIYILRIEFIEKNIHFIIKDLYSSLDYNFKSKANIIELIDIMKIKQNEGTNKDLIFKKFDELIKNKKLYISQDEYNNINLIIDNDNSIKNKYEIKLVKEKMNLEDKINIIYNHIKYIRNNNKQIKSEIEIININKRIDNIEMSIDKKEDDLKNILNEKDNIIKEINNQLLKQENKLKDSISNIEKLNKLIEGNLKKYCLQLDNIKYYLEKNIQDSDNKINDLLNDFNHYKYLNNVSKNEIVHKILDLQKSQNKSTKIKNYFDFIPEDEIPKFFQNFKKAFFEIPQTKDKKSLEFIIRSTKSDFDFGTKIEIYSIDEIKYFNYFNSLADYMTKSLFIFSISINFKDKIYAKDIEKLKNMKHLIEFVNLHKIFEVYLRANENRISLDFSNKSNDLLVQILDLGIDFSKFQKFKALFSSKLSLFELFSLSSEEVFLKLFHFYFSLKGLTLDIKNILKALILAAKEVKLSNEKMQKRKDKKIKNLYDLYLLNSFLSFGFNLELDINQFKNNYLKNKIDFDSTLELYKRLIKMFSPFIKNSLENLGLADFFRINIIDEVFISLGFPKYHNGFVLNFKSSGLGKALIELIYS